MNIIITDVKWDTDEELPSTENTDMLLSVDNLPILILNVPVDESGCLGLESEETIGDIISDKTGWCHKGFGWSWSDKADQNTLDDVKRIIQFES